MIPNFLRAAALAVPFVLAACGGASSNGEAETAAKDKKDAAEELVVAPAPRADQDMYLGSPDAPVTVIEYASVTCPHCAIFAETILPTIKEEYIDTGKVKFVFREFPTPPAEFAYIGSVLARCAGEKSGKEAYFLVIDTLFRTQRTWIYGEDPKSELLKIAAQVGMDEPAFDACLKRQDLIELINNNVQEGASKYEVQSTPSFVVNGEKAAIHTVEDFRKVLDDALTEKKKG